MISPAPDDALGMRIVAAIREALMVRVGEVLTIELIEERARNSSCYVLEVIGEENATR